MDPRIFTLEEAERALPLVRRVVIDLQHEYALWRSAVGKFELASAGLSGATPSADVLEAEREVTILAGRVAELLVELESIGCVAKGIDAGLVDFYALRDDHLVFLCWQVGEPHISCWHHLDAGVDGRQPVDHLLSTEVAS
jgi:hypothetical protein